MLAQIYRKCSAWTIVAAVMVGRKDFFTAYDLEATCDTSIPRMDSYPLPFRPRSDKKRSSSSADVQRRVRSRKTEAMG
jgi:hypothetical protein